MNDSLRAIFLSAAMLSVPLAATAVASDPDNLQAETRHHITHGPILGRLSSDGVGIWARTNRTGVFAVAYGTDPDNLTETTEPIATRLKDDNTGWVHLTGLKPATRYYYELTIPGSPYGTARKGTFRTLPDAKLMRNDELNPQGLYNFTFEFACGNNQNPWNSNGPDLRTFETMLRKHADEIDFAILNGDWLYESQRNFKPRLWLPQVELVEGQEPELVKLAPSITGVWQNYKHYLEQGPNLTEWHRQIPSFFTFDDHEILNDVWGAGTPGLQNRRAVFRDIGVKAWYDYLGWSNPTRFTQPAHICRGQLRKGESILVDPDTDFTKLDLAQMNNLHVHWGTDTAGVDNLALDKEPGVPNAGVYEIVKVLDKHRVQINPPARADGNDVYSIGRRSYFRMRLANCDFFVLDTRSQREVHDTQRPAQPGLSMLGPVQRDWLMKGVQESDADFIFVVSSVNFMIPHVGAGALPVENKDDAWTVFLDEREKLINQWDKLDKPVMVLTGDLHNSFAIKVTDNVWEFASGPHNSGNHHANDEGDRPANGPFKYGPREVDIHWSTWFRADVPRSRSRTPTYCLVTINNVFDNPDTEDGQRWVAFPRPQVIFRYYDGKTGRFLYAESILAKGK